MLRCPASTICRPSTGPFFEVNTSPELRCRKKPCAATHAISSCGAALSVRCADRRSNRDGGPKQYLLAGRLRYHQTWGGIDGKSGIAQTTTAASLTIVELSTTKE